MNLASFDLNLLKVLDALLHEGSTVRAGARIGLSQPAVSAALARLRHALDDPLFVRHGQGLTPTKFARDLELPLRAILDGAESLLAGPGAFEPAQATNSFRLSGSDFFSEMLMPDLAAFLGQAAPGVRVQQVDLVPDNYLDTIPRYDVDLALVPDKTFPSWADHEALFRSKFVVIARKDHPRLLRAGVSPGSTIPLDLFCELGHVLFSAEGKLRVMGDAALAKIGRERRVVMTMPVFSGVWRAVAGSDLIALLPEQLAHKVAEAQGLEIFAPPMPVPAATISMVWHRRHSADPFHLWMRGVIAEFLSKLDRVSDPA